MRARILITFLLIGFCHLIYAQGEPTLTSWMTLDDMEMENKFNEEFGFDIPYPVFGEGVKELEGKEITVEGFVIPLEGDDDEKIIILSKYPYSQCFFCGAAGPESVIDVLLGKESENEEFVMDQKVKFKGKLKLNSDDLDHLNYILENASIVK